MLGSLLDADGASASGVREHLERQTAAGRRLQVLALSAGQQKRLWELISGEPGAGRLLPEAGTAVFAGRNSLRAFTRFEKWFARQGAAIVGCNRHPLSPLMGPGYFTVEERTGGTLEFDYSRVPPGAPAGWPPVRPNSRLLARAVYGGLLDRVAWVTADVLVGAAYRGGAPLDSYFVLVRG